MKTKQVGELLFEEREKHRLSIAQLAQYTKIRPEYIEALESNSFAGLPPSPFVRGYVRTICTTLGLAPDPVIALLRRDYTEAESGQLLPTQLGKRRRPRLFRGVVGWSGLVVSAVMVAAGGYVLLQWAVAQRPPYLEVSEPEPFAEVDKTAVITGLSDPDVVVLVNDQPAAIRPDGSFSTEITFPQTGLISVKISAEDAKGKRSEVELPVRVR